MLLELTPVVRYWEFTAKELQNRLEALRDQNITSIGAWVPWNHLETDRHHLLQKLLRISFSLGLKVKLGITPELGIGYWNNGLPDDLLKERAQLAQDRTGQILYNCAPPNIHPLPSLSSPAVFQRYGHFLLKLSQEINEVLHENFAQSLELVVSDSLFKHYKTTVLGSEDHGDFSIRYLHQGSGGVSKEASPSGAESIFLNRTKDFLRGRLGKNTNLKITEQRVFSRSASLDRLSEELTRSSLNLPLFFRELSDARSHANMIWLDDLFGLTDRERNFLISASLVSYQQVWLSDEIFLHCSNAFKRRLANLIEGFSRDDVTQLPHATVFVANRFAPARLSKALRDRLGTQVSFEALQSGPFSKNLEDRKLIVSEEGLNLEFQQYVELSSIARKSPCTVVLFKSALCERALRDLATLKKFRVQRGWSYEIVMQPAGGQILFVEGKESSLHSMAELTESLVAVAELEPWCKLNRSNQEISTISVDWVDADNESVKSLFLLNPMPEPQALSMSFSKETKIQGIFFGGEQKAIEPMGGEVFEATLPAYSVVPLTAYVRSSVKASNIDLESNEKGEDDRSAPKLA